MTNVTVSKYITNIFGSCKVSTALFAFIAAGMTAVVFYFVMSREEHTNILTWALPLFLSAVGVLAFFFIPDVKV